MRVARSRGEKLFARNWGSVVTSIATLWNRIEKRGEYFGVNYSWVCLLNISMEGFGEYVGRVRL